jgi:hypothetical protein
MCGISRFTHPAILKQIRLPILELFPFFHQIFKILILFVLYFKNYKRQVVSRNRKHFQHVKIYLPCNFEVNPITHFDRLCKLEKREDEVKKKSSPQKPLGQLQPNFFGMILGWPPSKCVSGDPDFQPRWPPS